MGPDLKRAIFLTKGPSVIFTNQRYNKISSNSSKFCFMMGNSSFGRIVIHLTSNNKGSRGREKYRAAEDQSNAIIDIGPAG